MGGKVRRYAQSSLSAVVYCTLRCTARVALLVNQGVCSKFGVYSCFFGESSFIEKSNEPHSARTLVHDAGHGRYIYMCSPRSISTAAEVFAKV